MVSQGVWIVIVIVVFFAGIGLSYAYFSSTYDPVSMKFQNQELFDQMMTNNPRMSQQWVDSGMNQQQMQEMMNDPEQMNQWMNTMMNDPQTRQQMMAMMMQNQGMMISMMNNQDMMNMMMDSGMMMKGNMMNQQIPNENKQTDTTSSSYVQMIDGIQVVTITAKEFKFIPSEIHISPGMTKFVLVNNGVGEHEFVVYDVSKQDILQKAELSEDEETIEENILFEVEEIHAGETGESEVMDLNEGSYVIGCLLPGHFDAGMKGTLDIE
ncbi:MAG: plastocyanin/azurin family copper-binding protein [Nitrosopumilus sp.]